MEENWRKNGEDCESEKDEVPRRKLKQSSSRSRSCASHHHSRFYRIADRFVSFLSGVTAKETTQSNSTIGDPIFMPNHVNKT